MAWWAWRRECQAHQQTREAHQKDREQWLHQQAQWRARRENLELHKRFLAGSRRQFEDTFGNLARKALRENSFEFLKQARQSFGVARKLQQSESHRQQDALQALLEPLQENLKKLEEGHQDLERRRHQAYGDLQARLNELARATRELQGSNRDLSQVLRGDHQARGRWGESSLRRLVELAGMVEHVDFDQQVNLDRGRPDMVVQLPRGGCLAVDAKVPMAAFWRAADCSEENARKKAQEEHARLLFQHVKDLERRAYPKQLQASVDFTVLFLPHEALLSDAFLVEPEIQEKALERGILLATPVTFLALLRTVAFFWDRREMEEKAEQVWQAATSLHQQVSRFQDHLWQAAKEIDRAGAALRRAKVNFQRQVLPAGRRLEALRVPGRSGAKLQDLDPEEILETREDGIPKNPSSSQATGEAEVSGSD